MKKYEYTFRNTPGDYFLYRMGNIYSSPRALVNVIFTVAIIVLIAAKWTGTNWLGHLIMVVMLLIFPVFQPLFSYFASIRDAVSIRVDTTLTFDEDGMKIHVYKHSQHIRWRDFYSVRKRRSMLLVIPDGMHAYLLTNRILGSEKDELYNALTEQIQQYSKYADRNAGTNRKKR